MDEQEPQPEDPAEERKSPEEAEPLLNPKVEKSFWMHFPPHAVQLSALSEVLRAKNSNFSPQSWHLYS
ncbi:MAG: hypothetical protein A2V52_01960 [Actinobacteria bacterium RBG_19FT_COMBO_54_7]|uniref:Uncharacterized protein n=1 Tax=Candidatus Solincola sediminis TaxID=1797199 RepID=A0A1F2WIG0_9ACTN|nr:MAG: hypothetical protein A2Y75_08780 [Candidatus Solincola sediminis]OFW57944.1 MAG: hypothetical protein A2W01_08490 [Candidatus Solincola sediminis]OFW67208.1 MAG: hypothetical protein A2V52_01960 [Actinobacteria bacterium RBG_19FT_COMBO_54_7]